MLDTQEFQIVLMRMLALILSARGEPEKIRQHQAFLNFLKEYIPDKKHKEYAELFAEMLVGYESDGQLKKISSNSVKLITFCQEINNRFDGGTRALLWLRLLELISGSIADEGETRDYLLLVADSLYIDTEKQQALQALVSQTELIEGNGIIMPTPGVYTWRDASSGMVLMKICRDGFLINDRPADRNRITAVTPGMIIGLPEGGAISYSVLLKADSEINEKNISVNLQQVSFSYSKKTVLQALSLSFEGPALIAVMGRSGSGKSTLLKLVAGVNRPSSGEIHISGKTATGIGYVEQDEAFIAEFTVKEILTDRLRLLKNAGKISNKETDDKVLEVASRVGLSEQLHQKAGVQGNSQLSGGQRKKLAVALQLLTSPDILVVDEPISGLSSGDALEMMNMLRNLANQDSLILCSMHQPSFELLHLADNCLILDNGGYAIYYGETSGAASYIRNVAGTADKRAVACPACFRYEPANLIAIIEETRIDDKGKPTDERKISPQQWYDAFRKVHPQQGIQEKPTSVATKPCTQKIFSLTKHFFVRDMRRMIKKPLATAGIFVSAALLFLLIAFISRGSATDYSYGSNLNIPAAFLMMLITAIFTGMMVSGNEICGDKDFRRSESMLSQDTIPWVSSKILRMLLISVMLAATMVAIVFGLLQIPLGFGRYVLLMTGVFFHGAALGLLLSAILRQLSHVYFAVPLIVVPQLLLSGLIINYDNFPLSLKNNEYTPIVADLAATRWAFEAVAVDAFVNNNWEKQFYTVHYQKFKSAYYLNHLLPYTEQIASNNEELAHQILDNDIQHGRLKHIANTDFETQINIQKKIFSQILQEAINTEQNMYEQLRKVYDINSLKHNNHNAQLALMLTNPVPAFATDKNEIHIYRHFAPVFYLPENKTGRAHYFAPAKKIGNQYVDTFVFNAIIISLMNLVLVLGLFIVVKIKNKTKLI